MRHFISDLYEIAGYVIGITGVIFTIPAAIYLAKNESNERGNRNANQGR